MLIEYDWSYYQIDTAEDCLRKWGWERLDGVVEPKNKHANFGIDGHDILKTWLAKREFQWDRPASNAAAELAKHLPVPQEIDPKFVEYEFGFTLGGERFIGGADLYLPGWHPRPIIYDHKFTTDLYRWTLEPEEFKDDIQATLYAAYAMVDTKASAVDVQWTYSLSSGKPRARPVRATLTGRDIQPRIEKTIETVRNLKIIYESGARTLDLPPNVTVCEKYGGCRFKKHCNLSPSQMMEAIMSQGQAMSDAQKYLEELKARRNGQAVTQPINPPAGLGAPAVSVAPQPTPSPVATGGMSLAERMAARRAEMAAPAAPVVPVVQQAPVPAAATQAPPQAVVTLNAGPPPPAAAAEEKAARAVGRPKKDTSTPVSDLFAQFIAVTYPIAFAEIQPQKPEDRVMVAELAAEDADRLVMQHLKRFAT